MSVLDHGSELVGLGDNVDFKGLSLVGAAGLVEQIADVVAKVVVDFLTVIALVDGQVFIQRVSRKKVEVTERVATIYEPVYF